MSLAMDAGGEAPAHVSPIESRGRALDWPTLAERLLVDFPEAAINDVVRELRRARDAVEQLELGPHEGLALAAQVVRHHLSIRTGPSSMAGSALGAEGGPDGPAGG